MHYLDMDIQIYTDDDYIIQKAKLKAKSSTSVLIKAWNDDVGFSVYTSNFHSLLCQSNAIRSDFWFLWIEMKNKFSVFITRLFEIS